MFESAAQVILALPYELSLWRIRRSSEYQSGIAWGKPRRGHPEGTIARHIEELESRLACTQQPMSRRQRARLRLLIHVHDTFKGKARRGARILEADSHASLARVFLARYCGDRDLLAMVQHHDLPYSIYRRQPAGGATLQERLKGLATEIRDWELFSRFLSLDASTAGKDGAWLGPFFKAMRPYAAIPSWLGL